MKLPSLPFLVGVFFIATQAAVSMADDAPLPDASRTEAFYPGPAPGRAEAAVKDDQITVGTSAISAAWKIAAQASADRICRTGKRKRRWIFTARSLSW